MTCDLAREALLEAALPITSDDSPELAQHLRGCVACARSAMILTTTLPSLDHALRRRRATRRRRIGVIAAASTLAAAVGVIAIARVDRRATEQKPTVNASRAGIVSVQVPRGKAAMVLQTKDPNVTVIWLTDGPRSGS